MDKEKLKLIRKLYHSEDNDIINFYPLDYLDNLIYDNLDEIIDLAEIGFEYKGDWVKGNPEESGLYHLATTDKEYAGTCVYMKGLWCNPAHCWGGYHWSTPIRIPTLPVKKMDQNK